MIATQHQHAPKRCRSLNKTASSAMEALAAPTAGVEAINPIPKLKSAATHFLPSRLVMHHPTAGLNLLVDAAAYLFSIVGKLKQLAHYRQLNQLQQELIQEINAFLSTITHHGYNAEYVAVCRYILCATFDDVIANTTWGSGGSWETYRLLAAFNQDVQHHDKLFAIMERAINDPTLYIDLMELMYICLSLGYKGQYRSTEHSQYRLEQITNNLYKHIQAHRGKFSKTLSPMPLKCIKLSPSPRLKASPFIFIFLTTACIIISIFVSLGYLTDVISNEVYKNIAQIETPASYRA